MVISAISLPRAAAPPLMLDHWPDRGAPFISWSSAIALVFGLVQAIGTWIP